MSAEEQLYISIGESLEGAVRSQMFGKPCFKVNGKAFMSFFENELVFKLSGISRDTALALAGARQFDPSGRGRPMKEWIQIPAAHSSQWKHFAAAAIDYVRASSEK